MGVVRKIRRLDKQRRPVHDSSGWIHVDTDIWSVHHYAQNPARFAEHLAKLPIKYAAGRKNQPLLVSEYAGVGFDAGGPYGRNPKSFLAGYPGTPGTPGLPSNVDEALNRIRSLTEAIVAERTVAGYCCTQLYDVEWEKNGLLRYDRTSKYSTNALKRIFSTEDS